MLIASGLALPRPVVADDAETGASPPADKASPGSKRPGSYVTRRLGLFGLLLGIGLGNHLTLLAIAVPLIIWMGSALGWKRVASPWAMGAFVLGASVYVYLPLRAAQAPAVNWGDADTLRGAVWMLTARPYQEYAFGATTGTLLSRLVPWLNLVFSQFNPLGLFFGIVGAGPLRAKIPVFFVVSLGAMLVISVYAVSYYTVDFQVLMLPAFLAFSIWVGVGFFQITSTWVRDPAALRGAKKSWAIQLPASRQAAVLSVMAFLLLPGLAVVLNYSSQDLSGDRGAYDYAATVLESVPDGSVVFSSSEAHVFSLWYLRYVERTERDVAVIAGPLLQFDWYREDTRRMFPDRVPGLETPFAGEAVDRIVAHNLGRREVYFTTHFATSAFDLEWNGTVWEARELP